MRKFDLFGIFWKNRIDLCIVLKVLLIFFFIFLELIVLTDRLFSFRVIVINSKS